MAKITKKKASPKRNTKVSRKKTTRKKKVTGRATNRDLKPTAYKIKDEELEHYLRTGKYSGLLEEYFGEENYRELADLAREAAATSTRGGPRVYILPGIMGSKLGYKRNGWFDDTIWIDPVDIAQGELVKLALPDSKIISPLGVINFAYLRLKLRLKQAGYDADFYPFDWRQSIENLGKAFYRKIKDDPANQVYIVAHSMGGLVSRAALKHDNQRKVAKLIMLGTPNFGSFVPVQAMRGVYPLLKKVAALDLKHSSEQLADLVYKTLPSLYQMLPSRKRYPDLNFFNMENWPSTGPQPKPTMLKSAASISDKLAKADERFHLIAGVNQETIVGVKFENNEYTYLANNEGDGTVPLEFARLPDTNTYYVDEAHGSLANNLTVIRSVDDILANGATDRLPQSWQPTRKMPKRLVSEDELTIPKEWRTPEQLGRKDYRHILNDLVSPTAKASSTTIESHVANAGMGYTHSINDVMVSRRKQHSIEIRLAQGDITEADARSYVMGIYKGVEPSGASAAIDERLDGAVKEFSTRRMFTADVGEVFVMPTGRNSLKAESVLFAGLGNFDAFENEVQQFISQNIVRTFVHTHVEDFATVLMGTSSGSSINTVLFNQLKGFLDGMLDSDKEHRMRRITICENDPDRYLQIKEELVRLATTELLNNFSLTVSEVTLPPPLISQQMRHMRIKTDTALVYLIVNQIETSQASIILRSSLLTAGSKAAILTGTKEIKREDLKKHLKNIELQTFTFARLESYGRKLAALTIHDDVMKGLKDMRDYHLVIVHDAPSSLIPWETICIDDWFPATEKGLSRRYVADNLSVAKWQEQRRIGDVLDILLVINPTLDLDGAEQEGRRIKSMFPADSKITLTEIHGEKATRHALLDEFGSGKYDIIHYAGHAFFDKEVPSNSGILCHGHQVLSGADLANLSSLPALVFFNACESGRIRKGRDRKWLDMTKRLRNNVGLAEAFMRGGVANYIGTYWPVGDAAASEFGAIFYKSIVAGKSVGESMNKGRLKVKDIRSVDCADYIHYGSFDFRIKKVDE